MVTTSNYVYTAQNKKIRTTHYSNINDLPESLIGHILSLLPTKDAVKTCLLSRSWKFKWASITKIDVSFDSYLLRKPKHHYMIGIFASFVNRILLFSDRSRIQSFRLIYNGTNDPGYIETWITTLLRRNVEKLNIVAMGIPSTGCFSGWNLLTELKLGLGCTLSVSTTNWFPNLKNLYLSGSSGGGIIIKNEQILSTGHMLMKFPVLEALDLCNCIWLDVDRLEIQAPELITFKIALNKKASCEIKICGPKLTKFESTQGTMNDVVLSSPKVTYASLDHRESNNLAVCASTVLKCFQDLKLLELSPGVVKALLRSNSINAISCLYRVKELKLMSAHPHPGQLQPRDILELLQVLPSLESLTVLLEYDYQQLEPLPLCIVSHLKKLKIYGFIGRTSDFKLLESILKNAKSLETVTVSVYKEKTKIRRQLSKLIHKIHLQVEKHTDCWFLE